MDHSGHVSMKNGAKCDSGREMQNSVNVEFSNLNGSDSLFCLNVRLNAGKLLQLNLLVNLAMLWLLRWRQSMDS